MIPRGKKPAAASARCIGRLSRWVSMRRRGQILAAHAVTPAINPGSTLTYLVTPTDHLGNVQTKTIETVRVYGAPTITFDTEKTKMKSTDSVNAALLSATAKDSFDGTLSVSVSLASGTVAGGNAATFRLTARDAAGNVSETVSQEIRVYSIDGIQLSYTTGAINIKKASQGEEFSASATDSFGEPCTVRLEKSNGSPLVGEETSTVCIVATDSASNSKKSDPIEGIKVYDTPTLSFAREQDYIYNGESPYTLFSAKDSYGNVCSSTWKRSAVHLMFAKPSHIALQPKIR